LALDFDFYSPQAVITIHAHAEIKVRGQQGEMSDGSKQQQQQQRPFNGL